MYENTVPFLTKIRSLIPGKTVKQDNTNTQNAKYKVG